MDIKNWTPFALATLLWAACMLAVMAVEAWKAENAGAEKANAALVTEQVEVTPSSVPEITPAVVHTLAPATPAPSPTLAALPTESAAPVEVVPLESAAPVPTEDLPETVARYADVAMTDAEREELAAIVYLEAGNQCAEGQQAVAEVVFNRVISPDFPDTVHKVLHQRRQFSTARNIHRAKAGQAQYDAIDAALRGPSILPEDVVFFSRRGENDRVWGRIEDHVFCYGYVWD